MRTSWRGRLVVAIAAAAALVTGALPATAGLGPVLVKGGTGDQNHPTANATTLGYSANSSSAPRHYDAYIEPLLGKGRTKVNASRTVAFMGHMSGDSGELSFQQIRGRSSDVLLYDIETTTRIQPPNAVNTDLWEWSPSLSPGHILFGRNSFRQGSSPWKVMLFDRETHNTRVLDSVTFRCGCIWPGQVSDEYATWTKCSRRTCNVWVYDIVNGGDPIKVPNPDTRIQYFGGVSEDSQAVYYASADRSSSCGQDTNLMKWTPGGKLGPVVVTALSDADVGDTMYVYADGAHDDLYFARGRCTSAFPEDIYKVEDADTATITRTAGRPSGTGAPLRLSLRGAMPRG
jgi:hypothetical protein